MFARVEGRLPLLFLTIAVPAILLLAVLMPPFQVADELNHAFRADQISLGTFISEPVRGTVHQSLMEFGAPASALWFHAEVKQTPEMAARMGTLHWSGDLVSENFQNTIQYGPLLYLPQAVSLLTGRALGLSVARTVVIARVINGLAACAVGFLALRICRRGRPLMFTTLLLPMTLSEFASMSQDASIIALSILAIAVATRAAVERRPARTGEFALFCAVVAVTTLARPPQLALALLVPALVRRGDPAWRRKIWMAAASLLIVAAWMWLLRSLAPPMRSDWSYRLQFQYVLTHPLALPAVMITTFVRKWQWLIGTAIGELGWLDTPLPRWFIWAAGGVVVWAGALSRERSLHRTARVAAAAAVLGLVTATCFALYLSWTPVMQTTIEGLQGRYWLPVAPLLGWLAPARRAAGPVARAAWTPVLILPIATMVLLPIVIGTRYYGSWPAMSHAIAALLFQP